MTPTFSVNSTGFQGMIKDLSRVSGRDFEAVLKPQVGAVLKTCVARTKAPPAKVVEKRVAQAKKWRRVEENNAVLTINDGRRGGEIGKAWLRDGSASKRATGKTVSGQAFHDMNGARRWGPQRWARYQRMKAKIDALKGDLKTAQRKAVGARGLAKQSWKQIGDSLGIDVAVPGYAQRATPSNGQTYQNGTGTKTNTSSSCYFEISNTYPALVRGKTEGIDGHRILGRAIQSRINAFYGDVGRGVFNDIKTRAQRYQGIFVS